MIHLNQAASLALIYNYRATCGSANMISTDTVIEYERVVNSNLRKMNSSVNDLTPDYLVDTDKLFYFYAQDADNNGYYVLKSDDKSIEKRNRYIMGLPLDIVIASQKENALEIIGLKLVNGRIRKLQNTILKEEEDYYQEKTELFSLISKTLENPDLFYKKIGEELTIEEREYIKSLLDKSCNTCSNGCCRVEQIDKPVYDCIGWENNRIVGEYKVLKLNRKNNNYVK